MNVWSAEIVPLAQHLAPYARGSLERAAALAARLHADRVSPEHWLVALLADEGCAAARVVLHAFADPETIGAEVLALCEGTMVVGSGRTLPFSVQALRALHAARDGAAARGGQEVDPDDLFQGAEERLAPELRGRLALVPGATAARSALESRAAAEPALATSGPLFRHFSPGSLRALGAACRAAGSLGRAAIGPAHILLGALDSDAELRQRTGLSSSRVRMVLSGLDDDSTPVQARSLGAEERLRDLLQGLPEAAETVDVLGWLLSNGSEELLSLLRRQKITPALVARCRGAFHDPPLGDG